MSGCDTHVIGSYDLQLRHHSSKMGPSRDSMKVNAVHQCISMLGSYALILTSTIFLASCFQHLTKVKMHRQSTTTTQFIEKQGVSVINFHSSNYTKAWDEKGPGLGSCVQIQAQITWICIGHESDLALGYGPLWITHPNVSQRPNIGTEPINGPGVGIQLETRVYLLVVWHWVFGSFGRLIFLIILIGVSIFIPT